MTVEHRAATSSGHMEHIRFYPGSQAEHPSTVIGFSDGIAPIADDEDIREFLLGSPHEVRTLSDTEAAAVAGSLSLRHIAIIPPLSENTLLELVPMMLTSPGARNLPYGIMVVDNRHGEIPADRSCVSGPILGSIF